MDSEFRIQVDDEVAPVDSRVRVYRVDGDVQIEVNITGTTFDEDGWAWLARQVQRGICALQIED